MAAHRTFRWWHCAHAVWLWLIGYPFFLLETLLLGGVAWLVGFISPNATTAVARLWSRLACGVNFISVELAGAERILPDRSYVIMANHASVVDVVALGSVLPVQFRFVMKQELRRVPVMGAACAKWGCVFVARHNRTEAIANIQGAGPLLQSGASVVVFPEGTRSPDGELKAFKKGGFMVALALGVPILPVSIVGSRDVLPASSFALLPGRVRVIVHEPIATASYGLARRDELMRAVRDAIAGGTGDSGATP